jgi:hypothetical protein
MRVDLALTCMHYEQFTAEYQETYLELNKSDT